MSYATCCAHTPVILLQSRTCNPQLAAIQRDEECRKNLENKILVFLPSFQIAALHQNTAAKSIASSNTKTVVPFCKFFPVGPRKIYFLHLHAEV